ncbi:AMP-binding protein [Rhodococcus sp. CSLK01-03]|uniref:AMP-binding protein n=1 Tax=Rhodococcus indonesiensis TaxID=3055869 RepID=A0ABT7RTC4_9NOCA|nr:AMP-binding protein [Rhodococcus indonesiensis]MDM7490895.1 AMP-binding protein [Rhodococcus indonesiensis]
MREATRDAADHIALVSVGPDRNPRSWTYRQLLDDSERAAAWLLARYRSGEHIAVWAPNVPEWIVLQYGAALAGLVLVTANPAWREAELEYALRRSHAVGMFHVDGFRGTDMAEIVDAVLPRVPQVRGATSFGGWLDEVRRTERPTTLPEVHPGSPTQIQFTSGTTGAPKAAVLAHMAMVTNAAYVHERSGSPDGATWLTALPLFHTAGCGLAGMGTVYQRGTLVLAEVFDPALMLTAAQQFRAQVLSGVPAMLHAVLAHPDLHTYDLAALRIVTSGGDAVPAELIDRCEQQFGTVFSAVYGQTELSPIICQTGPEDGREDNRFTAGRPLPNVEVAIVDPLTGTVVPTGTEGEICARGYQQMLGYLDMPAETAATVDAHGRLRTGDLGTMDDRGYVRVTGRLKDMIIRGGENIYPREIEVALGRHPAVIQAVALGLPDARWGETVAAALRLDPAQPVPSAQDLQRFLRESLAPHKTPKSWFAATALPVNAMGKLQKFRLREQILAGELSEL